MKWPFYWQKHQNRLQNGTGTLRSAARRSTNNAVSALFKDTHSEPVSPAGLSAGRQNDVIIDLDHAFS